MLEETEKKRRVCVNNCACLVNLNLIWFCFQVVLTSHQTYVMCTAVGQNQLLLSNQEEVKNLMKRWKRIWQKPCWNPPWRKEDPPVYHMVCCKTKLTFIHSIVVSSIFLVFIKKNQNFMDIKFVANDFLNKISCCGSIRICGYHR